MTGIELFHGDITTLSVDAIVNAANPGLSPGGAVGMAIHRAAGPGLKEACSKLMRACHPGDAAITGAFQLQAKYVIHAVGPSWKGGNENEAARLAQTYRRCFTLAEENDVRTMAFPAISCGIYSYPKREAAEIALRETAAAIERRPALTRVIFALFTAEVFDAFDDARRAYDARP